ncbi:MAG: AGE family epimerase/isomerase, partial [Rhizobiales bacterium]|nr:AGE family epimerase/isomerase [Rhizobacter sp.]
MNILDWLVGQALPTWSRTGVDTSAGGFFEQIDLQGGAVEAPRRTRVVARQIYVFATAERRGWLPGADALVDHGLRFLRDRLRLPDGTFVSSALPDGSPVDAEFDLYEQAFALFALASARRGRADREALCSEALALLDALRARWAHPHMGFEESEPRSLPLRSNPHMHLLEAALAWAEISEGRALQAWEAFADELAALCLSHFISPASGAVHEQFDGDWRPIPGAGGELVEPGHQFEWAWLLMRWASRGARPEALTAAQRLIACGAVPPRAPRAGPRGWPRASAARPLSTDDPARPARRPRPVSVANHRRTA